ncbi:type II secretion system protein [Armatimonas sp.]|uniref:type IV pilus modification PilV family protein n=1 Tax=Armatimonas sp. TaxID=1872638 RepID=UPI00286A7963|nr:type II secretion system protein [Armatimonas sp.]
MAKRFGGAKAFTLIEVLVTATLVGVAVAGTLTAIGSLSRADVSARNAELLQRLASQKLAALRVEGDLRTAETSGDFSAEGYADADWSLELQTTDDENVEEATITATRGDSQQTLSEQVFFPPETTTTTGTGTSGQ